MAKNICIIPARGGSKRIPRKNIKNFLGKPIIAYSIEVALKSGLFDEVMVSTDDEEIAQVAIQYGAVVPFFRSTKNSDDFSTTFDVIKEVIGSYKSIGKEFDNTCCIYATAPFVTIERLKKAYANICKKEVQGSFSIVKYSYPIQRALVIKEDMSVTMKIKENLKIRSQDLEDCYHDVGQFYFYETQEYLEKKSIFNMRTEPVIVSELESQDIDNDVDWELAELKYRLINS